MNIVLRNDDLRMGKQPLREVKIYSDKGFCSNLCLRYYSSPLLLDGYCFFDVLSHTRISFPRFKSPLRRYAWFVAKDVMRLLFHMRLINIKIIITTTGRRGLMRKELLNRKMQPIKKRRGVSRYIMIRSG